MLGVAFRIRTREGPVPSDEWLLMLESRFNVPGSLSSRMVNTRGRFNMTDRDKPYVSILNVATVRAFSEFTGVEIDPLRFRMDVMIDGLPPFVEFDWVNAHWEGGGYRLGTKPLQMGDATFTVSDVCVRCKAICASPKTGERDLPTLLDSLEAFTRKCGYRGAPKRGEYIVMGIFATPLRNSRLGVGDEVFPPA